MAKRKTKSPVGVVGVLALAIVGAIIQYWYVVIPATVAVVALLISGEAKKKKAAAEQEHRERVLDLGRKLQKDLEYATKGKSLKTRLNNCDDALEILSQIDELDKETNIISNKAELRQKLSLLKKSLPIMGQFEKFDKHLFAGEKKRALKGLREILYHINSNALLDKDIEQLGLKISSTSESVSLVVLKRLEQELDDSMPAAKAS